MAGIKTRKGQPTAHARMYAQGQEWKPAMVITRKRFSNGHRQFMAAQSVQTGLLYKNSHGRVAPWHSIPFTSIRPDNLD